MRKYKEQLIKKLATMVSLNAPRGAEKWVLYDLWYHNTAFAPHLEQPCQIRTIEVLEERILAAKNPQKHRARIDELKWVISRPDNTDFSLKGIEQFLNRLDDEGWVTCQLPIYTEQQLSDVSKKIDHLLVSKTLPLTDLEHFLKKYEDR
ncbi:MAG: hypothetical protein PHC51_02125 [bacterium]|nr:hypothetical protein [bacterium]